MGSDAYIWTEWFETYIRGGKLWNCHWSWHQCCEVNIWGLQFSGNWWYVSWYVHATAMRTWNKEKKVEVDISWTYIPGRCVMEWHCSSKHSELWSRRQVWMVRFMSQLLCVWGKYPHYPFSLKMGEPQRWWLKVQISCHCWELNCNFCFPVLSPVVLTLLLWLWEHQIAHRILTLNILA